MKRSSGTIAIVLLCGLAGSAISSCKKKAPETASAKFAVNTVTLRERAHAIIKNKVRRQNVLILLNDTDRVREEMILSFLKTQHRIQKDPDMPRAEYEELIRTFDNARSKALRKIASARMTLRTHLSKSEWQILFSHQQANEDPGEEDIHEAPSELQDAGLESEVSP
jgi:hypothetical protein